MVAVMYVGMLTLGAVYDLVTGLAGVSDPWGRLPVLSNAIMAFNMTMPMALYMRSKRHTWRTIGEMTAAMLLPLALTLGPYLLGIMTAGMMMTLSHAAMIPLMAVAMSLRFREYAFLDR
jgi:flagellar biosynthetic protein FliP